MCEDAVSGSVRMGTVFFSQSWRLVRCFSCTSEEVLGLKFTSVLDSQ